MPLPVFKEPVWLLLLVPIGFFLFSFGLVSARILGGLRLTLFLLVLLALADPIIQWPSRQGILVVVADRSTSMPIDHERKQEEMIKLLRQKMGEKNQLAVVSVGRKAAIEQAPGPQQFGGFTAVVNRDASNVAAGLETALGLIPPGAPGRILLISDGQWTGRDPLAVAPLAVNRQVAIDYRMLERPRTRDLAIVNLQAPAAVVPNEAFLVHAWIQSPTAQEIVYEFRNGPHVLSRGSRRVEQGLTRLSFRDLASVSGLNQYQLTVFPASSKVPGSAVPKNQLDNSNQANPTETTTTLANDIVNDPQGFVLQPDPQDPFPENNRARLLVGVQGISPVLLFTSSPNSKFPAWLRQSGIQVQEAPSSGLNLRLEELASASTVILENVSASRLGPIGMTTLASWVQQTGGGLLITGGKSSFGTGGYFKSPIDPILPISMEMRQEHRKNSVAIAVVLDRSGSMTAPATGGTKMDLANRATVEVVDMLSPSDEVAVVAVDSAPHVITPMTSVAERDSFRQKILRIESMGGGIYVFQGLVAGLRELSKAQAETKHLILFSDAADSEEPGDYVNLLQKASDAGITVSVIGLGMKTDPDAKLLEDIAKRGSGQIYFTTSAEELPRLFAQDTFVVARSTFIDETTPIRPTAGLLTLFGQTFPVPPPVGGYNLCYLRDQANLGMVTEDEYAAPFVATWQAGVGRVACYMGEVDGQYTGLMSQWPEFADLLTSLVRWTQGARQGQLGPDLLVSQEVRNGQLLIELNLDTETESATWTGLPQANLLRGEVSNLPVQQQSTFHWHAPDTMRVEVPLAGDETVLATVSVPGIGPLNLPATCLPYSPEYQPVDSDRGSSTLTKLAQTTGGQERLSFDELWRDLPQRPQRTSVRLPLLLLAIVLLLLEVLERRTRFLSQLFIHLTQRLLPTAWRQPRRKQKTMPLPVEGSDKPLVINPSAAGQRTETSTKIDSSLATPSTNPTQTAAATPTAPSEGGILAALKKTKQRIDS